MTINIVLKVSFLKLRSTHCRSLCNIILIKLCGKSITRLPGQGCSKYLFFFLLDSRLAKYVPVHSYSNTKVYPCGWVCDVYWSALQRNLADHRPKVGASELHWPWIPWSIEVCTCVTYTQVTALLIEIHFFETTYFPQSREIEIKTTLRFVWRPVLLSLPS